jgi:hypothetical protein
MRCKPVLSGSHVLSQEASKRMVFGGQQATSYQGWRAIPFRLSNGFI